MIDLRFIIVNWNTRQLLIDCIDSIYKTVKYINYQICVVDNGSRDDSIAAVREQFPHVIVIENQENKGFAAAVNQALGKNAATYSVLINTDTLLHKNAIHVMYSFMEQHKDVGIVGAQLEKPDGTRQHSYDNYPTLATELLNKSLLQWFFPYKYPSKKHPIEQPTEVESVIGACMMIRNEAIKNVGKLDEDYFFFLEETDWCYRMQKAGWKVFHLPEARVIHLGGQSKKMAPWQSQIEYCRSLYIFFKKNRTIVSYRVFRTFYLVKILINLIANFISNVFVLFQNRDLRYRLSLYAMLLGWHLLLCPDWMGLKPKGKRIYEGDASYH
ncbi:MAG: glycosyltransferase [Planctomycetes bacterium]|uniref:glycosyltransferase family 2 protein n=1 Tax=Candidatus Wunengus californicus TaxID=3367619 RepID=UPI00402A5001|nr:glycosyltransferase [Planctomycetota bacterium]